MFPQDDNYCDPDILHGKQGGGKKEEEETNKSCNIQYRFYERTTIDKIFYSYKIH